MIRVLALVAVLAVGSVSYLAAMQTKAANPPIAPVATSKVQVLDYRKVQKIGGTHNVTVAQGEALSLQLEFKGDPGLFDPIPTQAKIAITDGKAGSVIEKDQVIGCKVVGKDTLEVFHFDALRKGTAEITFTNTLSNKVLFKLNVTVK